MTFVLFIIFILNHYIKATITLFLLKCLQLLISPSIFSTFQPDNSTELRTLIVLCPTNLHRHHQADNQPHVSTLWLLHASNLTIACVCRLCFHTAFIALVCNIVGRLIYLRSVSCYSSCCSVRTNFACNLHVTER